jgi:hypothetical protein
MNTRQALERIFLYMGTSGKTMKKKQPDRRVDGNKAAMFEVGSPHQDFERRLMYTTSLCEI